MHTLRGNGEGSSKLGPWLAIGETRLSSNFQVLPSPVSIVNIWGANHQSSCLFVLFLPLQQLKSFLKMLILCKQLVWRSSSWNEVINKFTNTEHFCLISCFLLKKIIYPSNISLPDWSHTYEFVASVNEINCVVGDSSPLQLLVR